MKCLNDLFQAKNIPLRNKFIRIFMPLLLIEFKQTNNQLTLIEILAIFEKLLATVDSTSRLFYFFRFHRSDYSLLFE